METKETSAEQEAKDLSTSFTIKSLGWREKSKVIIRVLAILGLCIFLVATLIWASFSILNVFPSHMK